MVLLSLSHKLLLLGIEALLSAQVFLQESSPLSCTLFLLALVLLYETRETEILLGLGLKQTGQVAVSIGRATSLHGHCNIVFEASDLLLLVAKLFSKEVVLSLEVKNLLRPVLLPKFCKLLSCKLKLGSHILLSLLCCFEIVVSHILPKLEVLSPLLAGMRFSSKGLNCNLLVLDKVFLLLDESLKIRDISLKLSLLGIDLCEKFVFLLHLSLSDLALALLSFLQMRLKLLLVPVNLLKACLILLIVLFSHILSGLSHELLDARLAFGRWLLFLLSLFLLSLLVNGKVVHLGVVRAAVLDQGHSFISL